MKINVTVDLEEMYQEYESENSFSDEIKAEIAHKVKTHLWDDFSKSGLNTFKEEISNQLNGVVRGRIEQMVTGLLNGEKLRKSAYRPDEFISFKEYAEEQVKAYSIDNSMFMNEIRGSVKIAVDSIAKDLKNRYDILFASQLVAKMNESGLLKDDVARLLLDNTGNG